MTGSNHNTKWEVNKYGRIVDDVELKVSNTGSMLRLTTYMYEGKMYIELWESGYCLHFSEDMNS
jgi:hypothetical protein